MFAGDSSRGKISPGRVAYKRRRTRFFERFRDNVFDDPTVRENYVKFHTIFFFLIGEYLGFRLVSYLSRRRRCFAPRILSQ